MKNKSSKFQRKKKKFKSKNKSMKTRRKIVENISLNDGGIKMRNKFIYSNGDTLKSESNFNDFHPKRFDDGNETMKKNLTRTNKHLDDDNSSIDSNDELDLEAKVHKKTLENLKDKDPEFYEYLQKHEKKLLEFDDDDDNDKEILSSCYDDDGGDDDESETIKITLNNVNEWKRALQNPSAKTNCLIAIKSVIKSFRKCVTQTQNSSDKTMKWMNIMNPSLFNLIIYTSLMDLLPALIHYLRLKNAKSNLEINTEKNKDIEYEYPQQTETYNNDCQILKRQFFDPRRSRNWKRVMSVVKIYLTDVLKMMHSLSVEARISFERHVLELIPFYNTFPHLLKRIIRHSIQEWHSAEKEQSRVLAFLILYRTICVVQVNDHMTKSERQTLINHILRQMYLTYAITSKTTNENTIGKILFMRNSLIELYHLDHSIAYQQCFIFMRQLSINLRKSIMVKEKNALKRVYNWQFIHSINLWSQLIGSGARRNNELFLPLLTPINNICFETLRLFSAYKYVPFRLHIISSLVKLASETGYFLPILRTIREIIEQIIMNKNQIILKNKVKNKTKNKERQQEITMELSSKLKNKLKLQLPKTSNNKSINLDLMFKVSKQEQMLQIDFIEKIIEKIYELLLYFLKSSSHLATFPEMILIFYYECRKKVKSIPNTKGQMMMKQLLDKCDENAKFITKLRHERCLYGNLKENGKIEAFEQEIKHLKTPMTKFYEQWKQFKSKQQKQDSIQETLGQLTMAHQKFSSQEKYQLNIYEDFRKSRKNKDVSENSKEIEELDDSELDQLNNYDYDDDNGSIEQFGEHDEVELTEEQMNKIRAKIDREEKNFKNKKRCLLDGKNSEDLNDYDEKITKEKKRKHSMKKKKNRKKARGLNPDLQLEGAFDISSDDDDD